MNILNLIKKLFKQALENSYGSLASSEIIDITQSMQPSFGHYQCNSAMRLAKVLKKKPRDIAQTLVDNLPKNSDEQLVIEKVEIAGPGFINVWLDISFLQNSIQGILSDVRGGIPPLDKKQKVVVDFSSPNIAKEMHVGHLRSTIIGDAIARLFEFLGHDVLRLNHLGDWGTSFGMLIAYLKRHQQSVLIGRYKANLSELVQWYREAKQCFDQEPIFKKYSQLEVVALQGGNPEALKAWEIICKVSQTAYREVYDLLDVDLIDRGESFYNPYLSQIVEELSELGLIKSSNGAKCVFIEGFLNREGDPLPLIVQKSDGAYNYATTDLAAIKHRVKEEKADRIIYVTDAGQALHFSMVFETAKSAGFYLANQVKLDHVTFGLVLRSDGKKFRTRSGETERLIDVLRHAISRAEEILKQKGGDDGQEVSTDLARALGINAIKYADLSSHRTSDYVFSYDKMLSFEGNTAAFLMYAYVRISGIKRKLQDKNISYNRTSNICLIHSTEITLALHLLRFPEAVDSMTRDLLPHRLTDYLYGLAECFHAFFRDCRVEGDEYQDSRLKLCETVQHVLRIGFSLIGLKTVDKM